MTTPMFDVDEKENERIILEESARRQDLIDQAVKRFAPELARYSDMQAVHLYSSNSSLRKYVRDCFEGVKTIVVEHCSADGRERKGVNEVQHEGVRIPLPATCDLVLTKGALNTKVEWLAARLKAQVVVVPEGESYLRARLEKAGSLILVGGDQSR